MQLFPINRPIVVDTETFYSNSLGCSVKANKKIGWHGGPWHYVNHKDFYCFMLSWYDLETHENGVIDDPAKIRLFAETHLRNRTVVAHNALFDYAVLMKLTEGKFDPLNTVDTMDLAQYLQVASNLASASKILLGQNMSKTVRDQMDGRHYRELTPADQKAFREYAAMDALREAQIYQKYAEGWPEREKYISWRTMQNNWRGICIDADYLEDQIDKVMGIRRAAIKDIPWLSGDFDPDDPKKSETPLSAKKLAGWCREVGIKPPISLAEDSEECQEWEEIYGQQYPAVKAMRDFRKSNTILRKFFLVRDLIRPDGTIPCSTQYCEAHHTGRFSSKQFNYQNLPRKQDIGDLRGIMIPPPGHVFLAADLSNIEARCLPWLAGDFDLLKKIGQGMDIYEVFARRALGYANPEPLSEQDPDLRQVSKVMVLSLGFSSGYKKFCKTLETNLKEETISRFRRTDETNLQLSNRLVTLYRKSNPKVKMLWDELGHSIQSAVICGQKTFEVQIPTGRVVRYFDLESGVKELEDGSTMPQVLGKTCLGRDKVVPLYGGKLVQNVTQHTARDVLVDCIIRLNQAGFSDRFSVHDEVVCEVPESDVDSAKKEIQALMRITPSWLDGCPIDSKVQVLKRYTK